MEPITKTAVDSQINNKSSRFLVYVLLFVIFLLIGGFSFLFFTKKIVFVESNISDSSTNTEESSEDNKEDEQSNVQGLEVEDKIINTNSTEWIKYSGTGGYKFSIMAPKDSFVCIGVTATGGDEYPECSPEGVYINKDYNYLFGVSFHQTGLDKESLLYTLANEYADYSKSDINIENAENQLMKEEIIDESSVKYKVKATHYFFTFDLGDGYYDVYSPTIYTDLKGTNYGIYHQILSTWKFE